MNRQQRSWKTRLQERKFLSAAFYLLFVTLTEVLELPIPWEAYAAMGGVLGLWIIGESYIDARK